MASRANAETVADPRARLKALRIHGSIARDLGIAIVSGYYKAGEVLDGEIAASDQLRVSRTAYREAVRILAAKGLLEVRPKTGTRISAREKWHLLDPDVLSWIFENEPDETLVASLFELRKIVEPEAASLAASRRTDAHVERMGEALRIMAEHGLGVEKGRVADQNFHSSLLDATGNPFLTSLTSGVAAAIAWTTIFKQRNSPLRRDPIPDHQRVFDAIAEGDPMAAHQAMSDLVDLAFFDTATTLRSPELDGRSEVVGPARARPASRPASIRVAGS